MLGLGTVWAGECMARFDSIHAGQISSTLFSKQTMAKKLTPGTEKGTSLIPFISAFLSDLHLNDLQKYWTQVIFRTVQNAWNNAPRSQSALECWFCVSTLRDALPILCGGVRMYGIQSAKLFFTAGSECRGLPSQGISLVLQENSFAWTRMLF